MKVLVGCEFSGIVRDAFIRAGHDAVSCDLLPSESNYGPHLQMDLRDVDPTRYDLAILHPPCTHLSVSGARWFNGKRKEQEDALAFFSFCYQYPVKSRAIENPVSIASTYISRPSQIIHPWQFGHPETKTTCLWLLGNLLPLKPTKVVEGREAKVHREPPSPNRWKNRSRTYLGIAEAMAQQWT